MLTDHLAPAVCPFVFHVGTSSPRPLSQRRPLSQTKMNSVCHICTELTHYSEKAKYIVEKYREGYPRFSALMSMSRQSQIFRQFRTLRLRMLLYKQDEVVELEEQLAQIEDKDTDNNDLHRGNWRLDRNKKRKSILKQLDKKLAVYGTTPALA